MKTEFLQELGLAKDVIDKIFAENGKDIAAEQAKTAAKTAELATANQNIKDLQDAVKKFDGVDVTKLKQDVTDWETKYNKDITAAKLGSALDVALIGAKARDIKAVKPFLNMDLIKLDGDKVLGLEEQLKNIKENKSFLFEEDKKAVPPATGQRHSGTETVQDTKKDEANAAFKSLFGKE